MLLSSPARYFQDYYPLFPRSSSSDHLPRKCLQRSSVAVMANVVSMDRMGAIGGAILTLSIVQIIVSSVAYGMTSWNVGSWWAGTLCCAAAVCALFSVDRKAVIIGCVLSVVAAVATLAGIIVDGLSYGQTNALDTCINQYTRGIYGSQKYVTNAAVCAQYNSAECVCVDGSDDTTCYLFGLLTANSCGSILTALPALLLTSMIFLIVLLFMVLYYSILICMTLRDDSPAAPPPVVAAPHVVSAPSHPEALAAPPHVDAAPPTVPTEPANKV